MEQVKPSSVFRYLKNFLKKTDSVLSILDVSNVDSKLTPSFFLDKTTIEFEHSIYKDGKMMHLDIIYKTKADYFIYLSKTDEWDSYYHMKILFEPRKRDEVLFFIKSINKKTT
jgi:hypothetical protein